MHTQPTLIDFLLNELAARGVRNVFGVAGDYSFSICDAICLHSELRWISCASELGAAYMADGAARVGGLSALCTTFGVGELSAINGTAGSFAERVPVVHLVGMPSQRTQVARSIVHHTLGDGDFQHWCEMAKHVSCAAAILTPATVRTLVPRLLDQALAESRPIYFGIAADDAITPVPPGVAAAPAVPSCDIEALDSAVEAILEKIESAQSACILVSALVVRLGLREAALRFVEASGFPFAAMWMDKSALDEAHPQYCGIYCGNLTNEPLREFVEGCDLVINLGALQSDLNLGAYTARLDRRRCVTIDQSQASVGAATFHQVHLADLLRALTSRVFHRPLIAPPKPIRCDPASHSGDDEISAADLFARLEGSFRADDLVFVETGTVSMGVMPLRMPAGADCHAQALWGSIGWATPAAIGGAIASPQRRCLIITGEGALQLTASELGTAARYGVKPIVIVVNNDGYLTERLLCRNPDFEYNDVARWNYTQLPAALGCNDWMVRRATTCAELDAALAAIDRATTGCLIEIITPRMELPAVGRVLRTRLESLYQRA